MCVKDSTFTVSVLIFYTLLFTYGNAICKIQIATRNTGQAFAYTATSALGLGLLLGRGSLGISANRTNQPF